MRVALPLMTAAGLLAATACSSQSYDQDAHRQALEDHGLPVSEDMSGATAAVEAACDSDDPSLVVFDFLNEGGSPDALRIGIEHMCPERAEEFEDALT